MKSTENVNYLEFSTVTHALKVADLEIWKGGFKLVGVAHKATESGRQRRITRAVEQPKYSIKM